MKTSPSTEEGMVNNTTPLALSTREEMFQGFNIRIAEVNGKQMMPLVDIATSLAMDRSNLTKHLRRNEKLFAGESGLVKFTTPSGVQELMCVSEKASIGLLYKIDAARSKVPDIENKIVAFQKWATNLIQKEMQVQTQIPVERGDNWSSVAIGHLDFAKRFIADNPDADPTMVKQIALRNIKRDTGIDVSGYRNQIGPAPAQFQEEWLDATHLGYIVNKKAEEVNRYLWQAGFLYRADDGTYYLTNLGAQHGKVFAGAFNSGHNGYFVKWRRSVIGASDMYRNSPHRIREDGPRY